MNTAKFLKQARVKAGLSQAEVAKHFGWTTPQFVSNHERGVSMPPKKIIRPLAKLLGVKSGDLAKVMLKDIHEKSIKEFARYI